MYLVYDIILERLIGSDLPKWGLQILQVQQE